MLTYITIGAILSLLFTLSVQFNNKLAENFPDKVDSCLAISMIGLAWPVVLIYLAKEIIKRS